MKQQVDDARATYEGLQSQLHRRPTHPNMINKENCRLQTAAEIAFDNLCALESELACLQRTETIAGK